MAFLKNYSEIYLLPNLHSNTITLVGQKKFEDYIAVKQFEDAFYAVYNEKLNDKPKDEENLKGKDNGKKKDKDKEGK